jgi:DSF synthase
MGALEFSLPVSENIVSHRIGVELDRQLSNTLWLTMKRDMTGNSHNFSLPLLHDLRDMIQTMKANSANWFSNGELVPVQYAVMKSEHPDYFNLGGDLKYFRDCIRRRDKESLFQYSKLCLDIMFDWATSSNQIMTTIALVQGKALGGGFEAALSADYLIAEEHSTFGFPEIMFGLFPCTGGMSLLARRIGVYQAERMLTNPRIYSAIELKEMGIVDEICPKGTGDHAAESFIRSHAKRRSARIMLQRAKHRMAPLDYTELSTVVDEWVDLAMRLSSEELRVMDMLIMMQQGSQSTPQPQKVMTL